MILANNNEEKNQNYPCILVVDEVSSNFFFLKFSIKN